MRGGTERGPLAAATADCDLAADFRNQVRVSAWLRGRWFQLHREPAAGPRGHAHLLQLPDSESWPTVVTEFCSGLVVLQQFVSLQQILNYSSTSEAGRQFVERLRNLEVRSTLLVPDNSGLPENQVGPSLTPADWTSSRSYIWLCPKSHTSSSSSVSYVCSHNKAPH